MHLSAQGYLALISLTPKWEQNFAESLVDEVRRDPIPYVRRWTAYYKRTEQLEDGGEFDGLSQSSYTAEAQSLCASCWSITIGKLKRDGFYDESAPVTGATVNDFRR